MARRGGRPIVTTRAARRAGPDAVTVRSRILDGMYAAVARYGIAKSTVEDAARLGGVSRATVYRHFPGGKDQLVRETIAWEVARFFERLGAAVEGLTRIEAILVEGLLFARRAVDEHEVLQKVLETEPDLLLPELTSESPRLLSIIRAFLRPYLEAEPLRDGVDLDEAADYVARMVLSFIGSAGRWDLADRSQVEELVRTELLAGVVAPA